MTNTPILDWPFMNYNILDFGNRERVWSNRSPFTRASSYICIQTNYEILNRQMLWTIIIGDLLFKYHCTLGRYLYLFKKKKNNNIFIRHLQMSRPHVTMFVDNKFVDLLDIGNHVN